LIFKVEEKKNKKDSFPFFFFHRSLFATFFPPHWAPSIGPPPLFSLFPHLGLPDFFPLRNKAELGRFLPSGQEFRPGTLSPLSTPSFYGFFFFFSFFFF